jgi:hypothetical protein
VVVPCLVQYPLEAAWAALKVVLWAVALRVVFGWVLWAVAPRVVFGWVLWAVAPQVVRQG